MTPHLNENKGIQNWEADEADLKNPDKILTAEVDGVSREEVISTIQRAGFKAEHLS